MDGPMEAGDDILGRLRAGTRADHAAIEATLGLLDERMTAASYRRVLERFHGFYGPLEDGLLALGGWEALGLDLGDRRKTPLLEADLRFLGVDDPRRLPTCPVCPATDDHAAGFGCLYVLEGATLGGQFISRHIRTTMGLTPDAGGRFFHGYGERTGPMWREFRAALGGFAVASGLRDRVVASALATFRALQLWCEGAHDPCPMSDR